MNAKPLISQTEYFRLEDLPPKAPRETVICFRPRGLRRRVYFSVMLVCAAVTVLFGDKLELRGPEEKTTNRH